MTKLKRKQNPLDKFPKRVYTNTDNRIDLRGRVKFPIGGKVRERFCAGFGEIPKPTVKSG